MNGEKVEGGHFLNMFPGISLHYFITGWNLLWNIRPSWAAEKMSKEVSGDDCKTDIIKRGRKQGVLLFGVRTFLGNSFYNRRKIRCQLYQGTTGWSSLETHNLETLVTSKCLLSELGGCL